MANRVHCPHCVEEAEIPDGFAGTEIRCTYCKAVFNLRKKDTIPLSEAEGKPELLPGFREGDGFGPYVLERKLGRGGMGVVFLATQLSLGRKVAIKVLAHELLADSHFVERFDREARTLAALNHPNVVQVIDKGVESGNFFLVMEYIDGVSLRELMNEKRLSPVDALKIVPQVCDALEYAHGKGVVHRDIKPENILLTRDGVAKIADFGLAKIMGKPGEDRRITRSNVLMGSLDYMAPEQREKTKDADHRSDIYSLGVVIYEMLTGELPLGRFDPPSKKVKLDVDIDEVVLRVLDKDPERRYQRASEVKEELRRRSERGGGPLRAGAGAAGSGRDAGGPCKALALADVRNAGELLDFATGRPFWERATLVAALLAFGLLPMLGGGPGGDGVGFVGGLSASAAMLLAIALGVVDRPAWPKHWQAHFWSWGVGGAVCALIFLPDPVDTFIVTVIGAAVLALWSESPRLFRLPEPKNGNGKKSPPAAEPPGTSPAPAKRQASSTILDWTGESGAAARADVEAAVATVATAAAAAAPPAAPPAVDAGKSRPFPFRGFGEPTLWIVIAAIVGLIVIGRMLPDAHGRLDDQLKVVRNLAAGLLSIASVGFLVRLTGLRPRVRWLALLAIPTALAASIHFGEIHKAHHIPRAIALWSGLLVPAALALITRRRAYFRFGKEEDMPKLLLDIQLGGTVSVPAAATPRAPAAPVPETVPVKRPRSLLAIVAFALGGALLLPAATAAYVSIVGQDGFAILDDFAREGAREPFRELATLRFSEARIIAATWRGAWMVAGYGVMLLGIGAFVRALVAGQRGKLMAASGVVFSWLFFMAGMAAQRELEPLMDYWRSAREADLRHQNVQALEAPYAPRGYDTIAQLGALKGIADQDEPIAREKVDRAARESRSPAVRALAEEIIRRRPKTETGGPAGAPGVELEKPAPASGLR